MNKKTLFLAIITLFASNIFIPAQANSLISKVKVPLKTASFIAVGGALTYGAAILANYLGIKCFNRVPYNKNESIWNEDDTEDYTLKDSFECVNQYIGKNKKEAFCQGSIAAGTVLAGLWAAYKYLK